MKVYYDKSRTRPEPRLHPYRASGPGQSGFVDFTKRPELIETALEDFRPFAPTAAVKAFYDFLRWINGPASQLATCDCVLRAPTPNHDTNSKRGLCVHGRVFLLYRELRFNASIERSDWLCGKMMTELGAIDAGLAANEAVVGFTKNPTLQVAISKGVPDGAGGFEVGANDPGFGHHLTLTFWAYGDTEAESFEKLERVFRNIRSAAERVSESIRQAQAEASTSQAEGPA